MEPITHAHTHARTQRLRVVMRKAVCCSKLYMQISAEVAVAVSKLMKDV